MNAVTMQTHANYNLPSVGIPIVYELLPFIGIDGASVTGLEKEEEAEVGARNRKACCLDHGFTWGEQATDGWRLVGFGGPMVNLPFDLF